MKNKKAIFKNKALFVLVKYLSILDYLKMTNKSYETILKERAI